MKSVKVAALIAALMVMVIFAGCTSTGKAPQKAENATPNLEAISRFEILNFQGNGLDPDAKVPEWLLVYNREGVRGVEKLKDYNDEYIFIGTRSGADKDTVITWVERFDIQQQIAAAIRTSVASLFQAREDLAAGSDAATRSFNNALNTMMAASYTGARRLQAFWVHQRTFVEGQEPVIEYSVYVLYAIKKDILAGQIKAQVERLKEGSPEIEAALDQISQDLLSRGLEWGNEALKD